MKCEEKCYLNRTKTCCVFCVVLLYAI